MTGRTWLNTAQLAPGAELYRSERCFSLWSFTVGHGQLVLRSPQGSPDWLRRTYDTTIEVLFKPATAMKLKDRYTGLVIRCATDEEAANATADVPEMTLFPDDRVIVLGDDSTTGYVICKGIAWREGVLDPTQRSLFVDAIP